MSAKQKVVIVGGGFGGVKTALELAGDEAFEVTLISDRDAFRYYPTLYHAATGGKLAASNIPLEKIFAHHKIKLVKDSIGKLDREKKAVVGKNKKYPYDTLILALGVTTNFFGIKGLQEYAFGIKSIEEVKRLRGHIHKHLVEKHKPDLNYIVIGGGPTGVELSGALPSYIKHVMSRHGISDTNLHIDLVEAAPRLVPRMPRSYSLAVARRLKALGVKLYLGETVEAETAEGLNFSGHTLESHTVIWTAGVANHPFFKDNAFTFGQHGKVLVNEYLEAEPDIYVLGDNADTPYSGMAQTALHDAKFVAGNLFRRREGHFRLPYQPAKPIYVTPVGPHWAATVWGKLHFYGWLGWAMRSFADFLGYHDLEPVWEAGRLWLAETGEEEDCPVCAGKKH